VIIASEFGQGPGYRPEGLSFEVTRNVDFLTSFPPGDMYADELWGPMREETKTCYKRICMGPISPHATAEEAHRNLMLTMAMDLSAKRKKEIELPIDPDELMAGLIE
jgi:hypothetical protein